VVLVAAGVAAGVSQARCQSNSGKALKQSNYAIYRVGQKSQ